MSDPTTSHNQRIACGGSSEEPHAIPMEYRTDAATPHWECPECGNRAWVINDG